MSTVFYAMVEVKNGNGTVIQGLMSTNSMVPGVLTIRMEPFMELDMAAIGAVMKADPCLTFLERESLYTIGNEIVIKIHTGADVADLVNRLIESAEKDNATVHRFMTL